MTGTLADALAGGGRYVKWDEVGTGVVVSGTVVSVTMRQSRKFESTDLDFWDDGQPKMQAVVEIATTLRDAGDPEDDGKRSVVVNLWSGQKRALADACRKAGVPEPRPGDTFAAVWTSGVGKAKDPRVFAYQITPGVGLASVITETAAAPVADPFTAAPPAMPADHAMAPPAAPAAPLDAAALLASLTPEQQAALAALSK
jgi:hypothetical protein